LRGSPDEDVGKVPGLLSRDVARESIEVPVAVAMGFFECKQVLEVVARRALLCDPDGAVQLYALAAYGSGVAPDVGVVGSAGSCARSRMRAGRSCSAEQVAGGISAEPISRVCVVHLRARRSRRGKRCELCWSDRSADATDSWRRGPHGAGTAVAGLLRAAAIEGRVSRVHRDSRRGS
jgi:hypothetical protein